jgi:uncharacterized phage-associated protein/antitoxin component HigA of HigAB toxin-antitoxin module
MKLKKLKIPKFFHKDDLGVFEFHDIDILFDPTVKELKVFTFDQDEDNYFLSDDTIKKLSHDTALRFYNFRNKEILSQKKSLSVQEMKGIKRFLGVNGADLGDLIGLDKSSVSRVLSGKQPIMHDMAMLLMERLKDEIQSPGYNQIVLKNLKTNSTQDTPKDLSINVFSAAEYLIRFFEKQESAVTNLKLQKLVYYAQGIAFGSYSTKLFDEPILAWEHGPVVKVLYDRYKGNGSQPLLSNPNQSVDDIESNHLVRQILDETISIYGVYTPWVLRNKTHNETPWLETQRDEQISDEKMISFFRKQLV